MRSRILAAFGLLVSLCSAPAWALEKATAQMVRDELTSAVDAPSLKPLFVFDMRGRKDPFLAYALVTNTVGTPKTFDINGLVFSGTIEVGGQTAALFSDDTGKSYSLRGNSLFDPQDKAVPGVHGGIVESGENNEVVLTQGDSKLTFSYQPPSKRLAADSQP
jgi:hypothetical protein